MDGGTAPRPESRRRMICALVERRPGSNYQDLLRRTGLANGILSHHLRKLEEGGRLRVMRKGRLTWFFPPMSDPGRDGIIISLRKETCRGIILLLLDVEAATFAEVARAVRKSPATVSYTLKQLVGGGVVMVVPGFQRRYSLCDCRLAREILENSGIMRADSLADRFADSFSYY